MRKFLLIMVFAGFASAGMMAQTGQPETGDPMDSHYTDDASLDGRSDRPLLIPNAFTPNGDGINDEFYIPNVNFREFEISIFDRWGNTVFSSNHGNFRWNGRMGDRDVPVGTYVFVLHGLLSDNTRIKRSGTITLVR